MKSWNNLPAEILEMIFKTITGDEFQRSQKRNLCQCALVCLQWSSPAKRVLYSTIKLGSERSAKKLITAVRMNNEQQSFGRLVRSLDINKPATPFTYIIYMPHFVAIFPFLEHLKAIGHDDQFYKSLISAEDTSPTWKHLKSIPKPVLSSSIQYYVTFALKHAKTLTSILLCDNASPLSFRSNSMIYTHQFDRLASNLNQFENLTHLQIVKFSTEGIEFFDYVIQSCQLLNSLDFNIRPITISFDDEEAPSRTESIDLSLIEPRPDIKSIRGLAVIYNDKSLLYLMKKYPQLDRLHLNDYLKSGEEEEIFFMENDRCTVTPTSVAKFLSYITKIPSHSVKFQIPVNILDEALAKYGAMSPNVLYDVEVCYERDNGLHYSFPENGNIANAIFEAKTSSGFDHKKYRLMYETGVPRSIPHRYFIEKFGRYIGQMNFSLGTGHIPGTDMNVSGNLLDHTFKHCTNLRHLTISKSTFVFASQDSIFTNSLLTDLVFEDVVMVNQYTLFLISKILPSLKRLTLKSCKLGRNNFDDPVASSNGSIRMPNTSFEYLYIGDGFISGSFKFTALYLKIYSTGKGVNTFIKFGYDYTTGKYVPTHCSMDEYGEKLKDKCFINMYVECASFKTIKIEYRCFSCQITI